MKRLLLVIATIAALGVSTLAAPASASHSWGTYHWGRTANPFTVKYGDNVTAKWDPYLATAVGDWNASTVAKMSIVAGSTTNVLVCNGPTGRVQVCNAVYGPTGWLGIAGISISGGHIVSGYTELNDFYFDYAGYNAPAWRQMVMCQELAHNLGLSHQDEKFNNANLNTCMDYTNLPASNQHPNAHDFEQLRTIYNSHLDATNTSSASVPGGGAPASTPHESVIDTVDAAGNGTVVHIFWTPPAA